MVKKNPTQTGTGKQEDTGEFKLLMSFLLILRIYTVQVNAFEDSLG